MAVSLREFAEADLPLLRTWANRIDSEKFMSRYMPKGETFAEASDNAVLWNTILDDEREVGVLWLEKGVERGEAVLGILLSDAEHFGRGLGQKAINLAIERLKSTSCLSIITLHVRESNDRAIACYEKCGFRVVGSGVKRAAGNEFRYLAMERSLSGVAT